MSQSDYMKSYKIGIGTEATPLNKVSIACQQQSNTLQSKLLLPLHPTLFAVAAKSSSLTMAIIVTTQQVYSCQL